jgi:hypothetical protein
MQTVTLIVFCATVLPLIFTPGPDIIYITTRGIAQGRRAALVSMLGVCAGYIIRTLLAVLGLTALLYASETLFNIVKYAGAAYLLYLGIKAIRSKSQIELKADKKRMSNKRMLVSCSPCSLFLSNCYACHVPMRSARLYRTMRRRAEYPPGARRAGSCRRHEILHRHLPCVSLPERGPAHRSQCGTSTESPRFCRA